MADTESGVIMDVFRTLVAAWGREEAGYGGITYFAMGQGNPDWDSEDEPPLPLPSQTTLVDEIYREAATVSYIDENGDPSATPTRRLKVTVTLGIGEANGNLREMALFGGTATVTLDSGEIVAVANFPKIEKPSGGSDFALDRTFILNF